MAQEKEIKRMIRLLESTAKIAQDASMTGMLEQGKKASVRQYNAILDRLKETEEIPDVLFPPLEEDASCDEVGVACKQLVAYLQEEEEPTKARPGAPFLSGGPIVNIKGDLKDLGELFRNALPEWMKKGSVDIFTPEKEPKETKPAEESETQNLNDLESQMSELVAQLQVMAERLRHESLSPDEIQRLADGMRELGEKHAKLAQRQAALRIQAETN
ncbi:hypothetical protein FJZ31_16215 [Candidatus Poribacteria bacterium]|nr:hypothetical protein [Candidatus Poribacteria bacterium]